jgi:hypothetical protein
VRTNQRPGRKEVPDLKTDYERAWVGIGTSSTRAKWRALRSARTRTLKKGFGLFLLTNVKKTKQQSSRLDSARRAPIERNERYESNDVKKEIVSVKVIACSLGFPPKLLFLRPVSNDDRTALSRPPPLCLALLMNFSPNERVLCHKPTLTKGRPAALSGSIEAIFELTVVPHAAGYSILLTRRPATPFRRCCGT